MKKNFFTLFIVIFLGACQGDEVTNDPLLDDIYDAKPDFVEYFRAEINGENFEVLNGDQIKGTVYPSDDTGNINFDFLAEISKKELETDFYEAFNFKVCFFEGPGTYFTGTRETVSWAMYWYDFELWENHYAFGTEPGTVTITKFTDQVVEGTFSFEGFNNQLENTILAQGEFGIILESKEVYHRY